MTEQEHNNVQWRKVKLEDVGEINPSNKEPIHSQFVYIDLESVVAGKLLVENHILKENAPSRAQRLVYYNDVLYQTVRPYQRNNYIHKKQGNYVASTGYALIRCYDDYEPNFVYYLLHTHNFESIVLGLCTGTSYPAIAPNNLKRIKISIPFKNNKPDLSAQRRIAAILASADKVIAGTQKTIAKYKQMKQGMMEDLLKPKEGWKMVKLGEFIELQGGFAFQSRDFSDSGVPLIRIGDITHNGLNISNSAKLPISYLTEYENFVLNINDTVIAMSGATTGKCTLVTQKDLPALLNQRVGRFRIKNGSIDKLFLYYIVSNNVYQKKLLLDAVGGAQPNVSPKQIESVFCNVPILSDGTPNLPEQRRIAAILSGIDAKIAAEEKVLDKYEKVKKGLMERLLEGE